MSVHRTAGARRTLGLAFVAATAAIPALALSGDTSSSATSRPASVSAAVHPLVSDAVQVSAGTTPPTQAQCAQVKRRCFAPGPFRASYGLDTLPDGGAGRTIAVIDSFGNPNMEHDLHVFNSAFNFTAMCGEEGVSGAACSGLGTFSRLNLGGSVFHVIPGKGTTGQEDSSGWAIETALDVEWAHTMAPKANVIMVTTPTAETLGVQGFPNIFKGIDYLANNHLADVISMSLSSGEEAFGSTQSMVNFEKSLQNARNQHVTVLASSGDSGPENDFKTPLKNPRPIPGQSVGFPASSPLVTAAGGTYLCTDPRTGTHVDSTSPGGRCAAFPGEREIAWRGSGGGFSHVFDRPAYQNLLPAGSTFTGSGRGLPDISLNAAPGTGVLEYISAPGTGPYLTCPNQQPCSAGWYVIGGTSASAPELAGIVATADQVANRSLGFINPALYRMAVSPTYAADFFDVTTGTNQQLGSATPGFNASAGWDAVTGLGTPGFNGPRFIADLASEVRATD